MALHEPFSLPSKETHLPESSTSPHSQPLSPHILTPVTTGPGHAFPHDEGFTFAKQPICKPSTYSLGLGSAPTSTTGTDSEAGFGEDGMLSDGRQPVSLLTALLHNRDKAQAPSKQPPRPASTGLASTKSSLPSTAFSSPTGTQHGILQNPPPHPVLTTRPSESDHPTSILRRGSVTSSDGGEFFGLGLGGITGFSTLHDSEKREKKLDPVEEKREKIEWADKQPDPGPSVQRAPSTSRTCALKFAVAQPPTSTQSSDSGDASAALRRTSVKRDAGSGTSSPVKRPSSPFAKERVVQRHISENEEASDVAEDEEDAETSDASEEVALPGYHRNSSTAAPQAPASESEESDAGYQEDEEDGAFSDEDEVAGIFTAAPSAQFPFARPTNYRRKRKGGRATPSPPAAPAVVSPPVRRGRGHIRVEEISAAAPKKGCTRHCSPPPARSRAGSSSGISRAPPAASSPSARKLSLKRDSRRPSRELGMTSVDAKDRSVSPRRSSDAGPREGRAGSPMPERTLRSDESESDTEQDDDEEEDVEDVSPGASVPPPSAPVQRDRGGWRSDDSVFCGASARTALSLRVDTFNRNTSAPPPRTVFESDADDVGPSSATMEQSASMGDGVRSFFRRASEHLPMFRRSSIPGPARASDDVFVDLGNVSPTKRDSGPMTAPMPSRATCTTCPPALDNTPAQAFSSTLRSSHELDLTSRLEQTLSNNPGPALSRATSTTGKVKFNTGLASMSPRPDPPVDDSKRPSSSGSTDVHEPASLESQRDVRAERVRPIACPTSSCAKDAAALGWTDEALRKIRRNAGKVE